MKVFIVQIKSHYCYYLSPPLFFWGMKNEMLYVTYWTIYIENVGFLDTIISCTMNNEIWKDIFGQKSLVVQWQNHRQGTIPATERFSAWCRSQIKLECSCVMKGIQLKTCAKIQMCRSDTPPWSWRTTKTTYPWPKKLNGTVSWNVM